MYNTVQYDIQRYKQKQFFNDSSMATYDSYASRHSKQPIQDANRSKSREQGRSTYASVQNIELLVSDLNSKASKTQMQQLSIKLAEAQQKIVSLTNIVKLVQKYTETQDLQYQKQRQTFANRESILNSLIEDHQKRLDKEEKRMFQIEQLYEMYKSEWDGFRRLKDNMNSMQNLKNNSQSTKTFKFDHRQHLESIQLNEMIKKLEDRLRLQLNRKIQICMDEIKNVPSRKQFQQFIYQIKLSNQSQHIKSAWSSDDRTVNNQIQNIKKTLNSLISIKASPGKPILKGSLQKRSGGTKQYITVEQMVEIREQIDLKMKHIVDKFSQVVKKYVGKSVSPLRHGQLTTEKPTLRKEDVKIQKIQQNRHPNISQYGTRGRSRSKQSSKKRKPIHASQDYKINKKKKQSRSRSLSKHSYKSKTSQLSKQSGKSKSKSDTSNRPIKITDKRKQKQQQLREMMRKTKQQKDRLVKNKKIRML